MEKKLQPILKNYNELIDLVSRISELTAVTTADDNGPSVEPSKDLLATQSIVSTVLKDACEWVRLKLIYTVLSQSMYVHCILWLYR